MNKIALALILLILPFSLVYTSPRKKVGIVLSGGGAKGVAHIGVIKALEELNIPIDYIAGTSIGAIIGGLYSIGYTSEQLETIVKQTDWIKFHAKKFLFRLNPMTVNTLYHFLSTIVERMEV